MTPLDSIVPMIFVKSVLRSIAFYEKLGFEVSNTFTPPGQPEPTWAWIESGGARLMLTLANHSVDASQQAVIFTLYCDDVPSFRAALQNEGIVVGEIDFPFYSPHGQFRVADPDGFDLTVTHAR